MEGSEVVEEAVEWCNRVVREKKWLFHAPTFSLGTAEEFFDGTTNAFVDPNGVHLTCPVVKLSTGSTHVASDPKVFIELNDREVDYVVDAQGNLGKYVEVAAKHAHARGIPEPTFISLLTALLRAQTNALQIVAYGQAIQ